uniref:Uncharacterized protein n=1 Tax=Arundo donax TaxID=35708 RepID=A0A0A9A6X3_ARUDO
MVNEMPYYFMHACSVSGSHLAISSRFSKR